MRPGIPILKKLMPPAFIAIISLSPESLPNAISVHNKIAIGNVYTKTCGKLDNMYLKRSSAPPFVPKATIFEISSFELADIKRILKAATPYIKGKKSSDKTYLSKIFIKNSSYISVQMDYHEILNPSNI